MVAYLHDVQMMRIRSGVRTIECGPQVRNIQYLKIRYWTQPHEVSDCMPEYGKLVQCLKISKTENSICKLYSTVTNQFSLSDRIIIQVTYEKGIVEQN